VIQLPAEKLLLLSLSFSWIVLRQRGNRSSMRYSFFWWLAVAVALGEQGIEQLFGSELPVALACLSGAAFASLGMVRGFVNGVFGTAPARVQSSTGDPR
jgi:hypothetical protein